MGESNVIRLGVFGLVAIIFLGFMGLILNVGLGLLNDDSGDTKEVQQYYGVVTEKYYIDGKSSTTLGAGVTVGGITTGSPTVGATPFIGSTSSSDEFILFINGIKHKVKNKLWAEVEKGDTIEYTKGVLGSITGVTVLTSGSTTEQSNIEVGQEGIEEEVDQAVDEKQKEIDDLKNRLEELENKE